MTNRNIILPKEYCYHGENFSVKKGLAVIVMHVYYRERFELYKSYVDNIPENIDIIFTVSEKETEDLINENFGNITNHYSIIYKENRGRDISAFLVAAKQAVLNYKYVCFIHDKKEKSADDKVYVDQWTYSLWENSLSSKVYIENIIKFFEENERVGIMVPPITHNDRFVFAYMNNWLTNYDITCKLLNRIGVSVVPDKESAPITLGTVFWARVDALEKLLSYPWKYDSFDDEPLPDDGTISHAIERCLAYVAQDAGYETKWIYTDEYAKEQLEYDIEALKVYYDWLINTYGFVSVQLLQKRKPIGKGAIIFGDKFKKIYIYGSGIRGKKCALKFLMNGVSVDAFLVSEPNGDEKVLDIDVLRFDQVEGTDDACVFIAIMDKDAQKEAIHNIKKQGFNNYMIFE